MKQSIGGGIVIDYTPRGYAACDIGHVIEARGNRRKVTADGNIHPLGQILAHDFLECRVGREGLYYENQGEKFLLGPPDRDLNIVDTSVSIHAPTGNVDRQRG
jgi:hypothetical protein